MSAIITTQFRVHVAELIKKEFDPLATDKNYYLFVGKPFPWKNPDYLPYEPPIPTESGLDEYPPFPKDMSNAVVDAWQDMLSLKRIIETYISHVIKRYPWENGTVFAEYNPGDPEWFAHPTAEDVDTYAPSPVGPIYCVTEDFRVYKCLSNNGGTPSTEEPVGVSPTDIIEHAIDTSDGYKWKYMFTVSAPDILKFATEDWIPVKYLESDDNSYQWQVQQNAQDGAIEVVGLDSTDTIPYGGSNYTDVVTTNIASSDRQFEALGLDGADAIATLKNTTSAPTPGAFDPSSDPLSYVGCTLHIADGTPGSGHQYIIKSYDHINKIIKIEGDWVVTPVINNTVYEILPTLAITGDGTGAKGKVLVDPTKDGVGRVIGINISGATGYRHAVTTIEAPAAYPSSYNGNPGGITAICSPRLAPIGGHGHDPVEELAGHYLMLNVKLAYDEGSSPPNTGDFMVSNDYRRIGIVKGVVDFGTTTPSTLVTRKATWSVLLKETQGIFVEDEIFDDGSGVAGRVVEFKILDDSNPSDVKAEVSFYQDESTGFEDPVSQMVPDLEISGGTSGATAKIESLRTPEIEKYIGDILYVEQRRPIKRAIDQLEDIKLIIEL